LSTATKYGTGDGGKLKELIPRHQFKVPIQAAIGVRSPLTEGRPSYGGDISRKKNYPEAGER